jgi:hypothetical protein
MYPLQTGVEMVMNKKFLVSVCGGVLLLPLVAAASGTGSLPVTLPTTSTGTAKLGSTGSSTLVTAPATSTLPQMPVLAVPSAATPSGSSLGSSSAGDATLPGLDGLGSSSNNAAVQPRGIRPIRLPPGPNLIPLPPLGNAKSS